MSFFIANTVLAQSDPNKTLNKFTGTWFGSVIKNYDHRGPKQLINIGWRIHNIDNSRKEIELTEISPFLVDSSRLTKSPSKVTYKGYDNGDSLVLEFSNLATNDKVIAELKVGFDDGSMLLTGKVERSQTSKDCFAFMLVKTNTDTSTYVQPKDNELKIDIIKLPYKIEKKPSLNK